MDLQDMGWGRMNCIDLAEDRDRRWALLKAVFLIYSRIP
jgi:hypothetical protein